MLEQEACCTVAVPLLVTLWHLHQRDIIHADIKIDNIFMTQKRVMLGDFGMAQTIRVGPSSLRVAS
jgi:serine/threonine protein kinase